MSSCLATIIKLLLINEDNFDCIFLHHVFKIKRSQVYKAASDSLCAAAPAPVSPKKKLLRRESVRLPAFCLWRGVSCAQQAYKTL